MSRLEKSPESEIARKQQNSENDPLPKPPEITALLSGLEELLQQGEPKKALDRLSRAKSESPWLRNALGVCQLRQGSAQFAVDILRPLIYDEKAFAFREDVPVVFKTNFATAMLLTGNVDGCMNVLKELKTVQHPAVEKLRGAIQKWANSFSLLQKIMWWLGTPPNKPVVLDYPPGDLS